MIAYVPNALTILRIVLTIVAIVLIPLEPAHMYWYLFWIFTVAAVTDFLDGYIARKYNVVTNFGKVFDPLADKVLSFVFLIVLYGAGIVPPIIVLLLVVRDLIIDSVRGIFTAHAKVVQAIFTAKAKTAVTFVFIAVALYALAMGTSAVLTQLAFVLSLIALVFSYISALQYAFVFYRLYHDFTNNDESVSSST